MAPAPSLTLILGEVTADMALDGLVICGWTGRNAEAMEHHIQELEALGVKRPSATPAFYRVAASLVTTAPVIQVSGQASSGEVEYVMLNRSGEWWVTVGSDHTDRDAETLGVSLSKQMCAKPVGKTWWRYTDICDHWDELRLRSWIVDGDDCTLYQDGSVSAMQPPEELMRGYGGLPENWAFFGGTLAAIGGVRPSSALALELHDPIKNRTINHQYQTDVLPIAD
ncbi:MAG: DUF2848 domain-containing protein [Rhodospirillaceae bacterium]|nr:DUF2848 domain-containing protein [Rhodospirillaceae bacterium]